MTELRASQLRPLILLLESLSFLLTEQGHTFMMLSQMLAVCRANIDNQDRDK